MDLVHPHYGVALKLGNHIHSNGVLWVSLKPKGDPSQRQTHILFSHPYCTYIDIILFNSVSVASGGPSKNKYQACKHPSKTSSSMNCVGLVGLCWPSNLGLFSDPLEGVFGNGGHTSSAGKVDGHSGPHVCLVSPAHTKGGVVLMGFFSRVQLCLSQLGLVHLNHL